MMSRRLCRITLAALLPSTLSIGAASGASKLLVVDAAGRVRPLDALTAGRRVAVHFWATWCAPCLTELPRLAQVLRERPEVAARVVIVSVDSAPYARVAAFLAGLNVDISSLKVVEGNAGAAFGILGYPATVFLDAQGAVVARHAGPLDWRDAEALAALGLTP